MSQYQFNAQELSDAERVAGWSATALSEQRYELGYALARLAALAHRAEQTVQPQPITELPSRPTGQLYVVPSAAGPTSEADAARAAVEKAFVEQEAERPSQIMWGTDQGQTLQAVRCAARMVKDGVPDVCWGVMVHVDGNGWGHLNPDLDQDHRPFWSPGAGPE